MAFVLSQTLPKSKKLNFSEEFWAMIDQRTVQLLNAVNCEDLKEPQIVQLVLNISHIGHNMSKYRPKQQAFEEVFLSRARDLIHNHLTKLSTEYLRNLTYDIIFILRSMLRYEELESVTVDKFSQVMLPIYMKGDPVAPGS